MTRLRIQRIHLPSLVRHGCLLAVALAAMVGLACGPIALWVAANAHRWIESWHELPISLFGQEVARIDLVQALGLQHVAETLNAAASASPLIVLVSVAWLAAAVGLFLSVGALLLGLAYNGLASITGGIIVEAEARPARRRGPGG